LHDKLTLAWKKSKSNERSARQCLWISFILSHHSSAKLMLIPAVRLLPVRPSQLSYGHGAHANPWPFIFNHGGHGLKTRGRFLFSPFLLSPLGHCTRGVEAGLGYWRKPC
jgi:hypothetical protein